MSSRRRRSPSPPPHDSDNDNDEDASSGLSSSSSSSSSLSDREVAHVVARVLEKRRRRKKRRHHQQMRQKMKRALKREARDRVVEWSPSPAPTPRSLDLQQPPDSGVYVLQTLSGDAPSFYVGKSSHIAKRVQDHRDGMGTPYLAGCDVARVPLCTAGSSDDLESWERNETLQRMLVFGIDNVRGWMFTDKHLQPADRRAAFAQICEKNDLCRRCGRDSHFKSNCFAKSTAPWANGMAL